MPNEVLDNCQWFSQFSEPLKNDIAKLMVPFKAPEGHVFIREGEPINSFLIVESGTLSRTKLATANGGGSSSSSSSQSEDENGHETFHIDEIGAGRVTGFLHVAGHPDEELSFATISAGKGGAKVWVVPGDHFRKLTRGNPDYSSEVIKVSAIPYH